jgi:putative ABC transport system ATP-binding protein
VIDLLGICKRYRMGATSLRALDDVTLRISRNEYVALTGASGSGKSTMMNIIGCLDSSTSGEYNLDGTPVNQLQEDELAALRNLKIGFIFQSFYLFPRMSALDNVAQPLIYRGDPPAKRRDSAQQALERVGLADRMSHRPNELSGGQRQRVAIARALVGSPEVVLADEPTGNLDSHTSQAIMQLFARLHAEGQTLVVVTHDSTVASHCKRVVRLHDGRVVEDRAT